MAKPYSMDLRERAMARREENMAETEGFEPSIGL